MAGDYRSGKHYSANARRFKAKYRHTINRRAWARVAWGVVALMRYDVSPGKDELEISEPGVMEEIDSVESGPTVRLLISKTARKATSLDLTALTEAELDALHKVVELAFQQAKPVCRLRDQEAQDAFAAGDDSYNRVYRRVPELVIREGEEREHGQSLRLGSEDIPPGESGGDHSSDVRADGAGVVEHVPLPQETQDGESSPDEPEGIREVGTDQSSRPSGLQRTEDGEESASSDSGRSRWYPPDDRLRSF